MRTVTKDTLTKAFMDNCGPDTDPRLLSILQSLASHLHEFTKEVNLTHAEWRQGLELLMKAGDISSPERNEYVLLSDVMGLSSLVDMVNSPINATPSSVLGPFHILGAPDLPVGGDLKRDNIGATVVVSGVIRHQDGSPVKGAELEIWQTAENGLYSNMDPTQADYNLRAHMKVGEDGRYLFTTVRPAPYTVPEDGPVGELLRATGRHPWRPSHLHFIVTAPGLRTLVTEVFPSDDPYLDQDAVFGVREDLVMEFREESDLAKLPHGLQVGNKVTQPYFTVDFDFVLAPE